MLPPLFQRLSGRRIRWIVIGVVSLSLVLFSSENRTTPTSFSAVGGLLSTKTGKEERAHVRFVPYPHRNIGSGEALSCSWRSRESLSPEAVESLVGRAEPIDLVQDLTLSNGVCLPISGSFLEQLHLYSANQARNCLKNRTLIVSGDSSAFGLFVGLGDVLLGRPLRFSGNDEHSRSTILQSTIEDVQLSTTKDDSFPNLRWECQQSCDGRRSSHQIPACSDCLRQLRHHAQKRDAVVVVGNEAPMLLASNESEVRSFSMVQKSLKVLYALSPTANAATSNRPFVGSSSSYWRSLRLMKKHAIPVADFFQMTRACCLNDTTTEEGHVRRYVNRWKAIQVLNILCEYREGPVNTPSIVQRSEFFEPAIPSSRKSSPPVGKEDRKGPPAEKGSGSSTHGFLRHEQTEEGDRHASRNQSHSANTSQVLASFSNLKPAPQSLELEEPPVNETTIRQVGFPHNDLGVGTAAVCWWVPKDQGDVDDGVVSSLLGGDLLSPDAIQARAFEETICVPESKAGLSKLHLFSTLEARTCLSNVTVALTGDSYSRQLFIGLSEILLANPSNDHIRNGSQRIAVLKESGDALRSEYDRRNGSFPDVQWVCFSECFGREAPFWKLCSDCLNEFRANNTNRVVVPVIGSAIHIFARNHSVNETMTELTRFFDETPNIVYETPPAYQISKIPNQYRNSTDGFEQVYWGLLSQRNRFQVRFLDFYQLTHTCYFDNCTSDGGHRSRFVNRWKAQLLLNTLCDYVTYAGLGS